ncbi:MAG: TlyA family rRNA (cytidine-2'-O)-methyltransferase, partial [Allorhizobium sp.]
SLGLIPSPISGGDGNDEFLLAGVKPLGADHDEDGGDSEDMDLGDDIEGDEA